MNDFDKVKEFIAGKEREMVELETLLSSIPAMAPESGGDGELVKCEALVRTLKKMGFQHFERFDAPDSRTSSGVRPNLAVTVNGKNPDKNFWIMSHMDVVPPGDLEKWNSDPWTLVEKDGKIIARGVEDNQQGLVSSVFAALSFIKLGIIPEYNVKLLFVADEEVGSKYGILYLLKEYDLFNKDDLILVPDGGDPKGETIEVAEKTTLWVKVITKGIQTHASTPESGNNAFIAASDLVLRLNGLEKFFDKRDSLFSPDYSTFQPTKKDANVPNINTIPGDDVFYMDCRILPCFDAEKVLCKMEETAREIEKKYGVTVKLECEDRESSPATPNNAPIVKILAAAVEKTHGKKTKLIGIGGGTVAACLRNAGLDAVVWSTLEDTAHQPNEYACVKNIVKDAQVMAAMMFGVENIE